jgi:hypothetical protein
MATERTRGMHVRQADGYSRRGTSEGQIVLVEPRFCANIRMVAVNWSSVGVEEEEEEEVGVVKVERGFGLAFGFLAMMCLYVVVAMGERVGRLERVMTGYEAHIYCVLLRYDSWVQVSFCLMDAERVGEA